MPALDAEAASQTAILGDGAAGDSGNPREEESDNELAADQASNEPDEELTSTDEDQPSGHFASSSDHDSESADSDDMVSGWIPQLVSAPVIPEPIRRLLQQLNSRTHLQRLELLGEVLRMPIYDLPLRMSDLHDVQQMMDSLISAHRRCQGLLWATQGTPLFNYVRQTMYEEGEKVWEMCVEWRQLDRIVSPYWRIIPFRTNPNPPARAYVRHVGGYVVAIENMFSEPITQQNIGPLYWNHRVCWTFMQNWGTEFWMLGTRFGVWNPQDGQ